MRDFSDPRNNPAEAVSLLQHTRGQQSEGCGDRPVRSAGSGGAGMSPQAPPHTGSWLPPAEGSGLSPPSAPPGSVPFSVLHLGREEPRHSSVTSWSPDYRRSQTVQEPHMQTFGPSRCSLIFLFIKLHIPPPTYILRGGERKCEIMTLSRTAFLQNHE